MWKVFNKWELLPNKYNTVTKWVWQMREHDPVREWDL